MSMADATIITSVTMGIANDTTAHDLTATLKVWSDGWTSLDLTVKDWHDYAPKGQHDWWEEEAISWPLIPTASDVVDAVQAFLWERIDY